MIWHYDSKTRTRFTYSTSLGMGFVINPFRFNKEQDYELWMKSGDTKQPVGQRFISYAKNPYILKDIARAIFNAQQSVEKELDEIEKEST